MNTDFLRFGKMPATKDARDLKFADYLTTTLPVLPKHFGHEDKLSPRLMLGNGPDDTVRPGFLGAGNCVFAAFCNAIRLMNATCGITVPFTGKEAIAAYSEFTGYVIGEDSTDNGTNMRDALNWLRNTGIADANGVRHKIGGFVSIEPGNMNHFLMAMYIAEMVFIGVQWPSSAMGQFEKNKPLSYVKGASNEGGHCLLADAKRKYIMLETWAKDQPAQNSFITHQMDEAYAVFSTEMLKDGKTVDKFDIPALQTDLAAISKK